MSVAAEGARFRLGEARGHYESWFVRGNHPTRPLAFWVRYTVTSPANHPGDAVAELFAIVFDGERGRHVVTRAKRSLTDAIFPTEGLGVRIGGSHLERSRAWGAAASGGHAIGWELHIEGGGEPLLLLPDNLYSGAFPRAKSLIIRPNVTFSGVVQVDADKMSVDGWRGSVNHNWGERHTDRYAWGQVIGFPEAPDTVLELATARLALGPILTPPMTPIVLRHRGTEHRLNSLMKLFGRATLDGLSWRFKAKGAGIALAGTISAAPLDVVTLVYANPPGGEKLCVNTKIAACELTITTAQHGVETLRTPHGAAFELLVDKLSDIGVPGLPAAI